jgi:four helix bundle protein
MNEPRDNIIVSKSYSFALKVIELYKYLISEKKEYVMSKQFLRCGTSIGANVHEAVASESKKDFIHKLGIAVKEARETSYWLRLLKETNYISQDKAPELHSACEELIKILNSIILTTKGRYFQNIHNS